MCPQSQNILLIATDPLVLSINQNGADAQLGKEEKFLKKSHRKSLHALRSHWRKFDLMEYVTVWAWQIFTGKYLFGQFVAIHN